MSDRPPATTIEIAIRAAQQLGVPAIILAVLLWLIRDAAVSLHTTVLVPIVQSHTEFLESTRSTLEEIGKTQQQQATTMSEIAAGQREIKAAVTTGKRAGDSGG